MLLRRALVVDNDDSAFDGNKYSRLKLKILPEMKDIQTDKLPWIKPLFNSNGCSSSSRSQSIPEKDSYVFVIIFDEYWKDFRYLSGVNIEGYKAYEKFENEISSLISEIGTQTYPQPVYFDYFADGSAIFRNTSTGEFCIVHNSGSYYLIDATGNIYFYGEKNEIKIYNDNAEIEISNTGELTIDTKTSNFSIKNNSCTIEADITNGITLTGLLGKILVP